MELNINKELQDPLNEKTLPLFAEKLKISHFSPTQFALPDSAWLFRYVCLTQEQRRLLFKEPWLLRNFDYKTRMEILSEYTPEQQANMKARMDLEDDFRREKRKGFG